MIVKCIWDIWRIWDGVLLHWIIVVYTDFWDWTTHCLLFLEDWNTTTKYLLPYQLENILAQEFAIYASLEHISMLVSQKEKPRMNYTKMFKNNLDTSVGNSNSKKSTIDENCYSIQNCDTKLTTQRDLQLCLYKTWWLKLIIITII